MHTGKKPFLNIRKIFLEDTGIHKNALIYSIGNYSSKAINILIFPIIVTQLGLADTGRYDLVVSTALILTPIFSLQMGDAIYRWLNHEEIDLKKVGFTNGLFSIGLLSVLVLLLSTVLHFIGSIEFLWYGAFILLSQVALNSFEQIIRGAGKITTYTVSIITRTLIFGSGSLIAVYMTENKLENVLLALIVANLSSMLLFISGTQGYLWDKRVIMKRHILSLLRYSAPLVINALNWIFLVSANKYLIVAYLGIEQNGVFAVVEKIATPVIFLGMFFYYSSQDFFLSSTTFKEQRSVFAKLIKKVTVVSLIVMVLLILTSYLLIPILFPDLQETLIFLPIIALANLFMVLGIYYGIPYNYDKRTTMMAKTSLAGVLITLGVSVLSIRHIGLYGVCIGILLGTTTIYFLRSNYVRRHFWFAKT